MRSPGCKYQSTGTFHFQTHILHRRSTNANSSWLVFNGLDTFTTVRFCGHLIGTTDNQFRQYTFDISDALRKCKKNATLGLNFGSAPKIVNAIADDPKSQSESKSSPAWPILPFLTIAQNGRTGSSRPLSFPIAGSCARSNPTLAGIGVQPSHP